MLVSSKYRLQAAPPFQFQGTRHHALSPGPSRVQLLSVVMLVQVSCEHAEALQPPTTSPSAGHRLLPWCCQAGQSQDPSRSPFSERPYTSTIPVEVKTNRTATKSSAETRSTVCCGRTMRWRDGAPARDLTSPSMIRVTALQGLKSIINLSTSDSVFLLGSTTPKAPFSTYWSPSFAISSTGRTGPRSKSTLQIFPHSSSLAITFGVGNFSGSSSPSSKTRLGSSRHSRTSPSQRSVIATLPPYPTGGTQARSAPLSILSLIRDAHPF